MTFNKTEWQREYRKRKKMEAEQQLNEQSQEQSDQEEIDPELSIEEKDQSDEDKEKQEDKKTVKEVVRKPPANKKKGKKGQTIPLNPQAFARMSVSIERLTLQVHKDKELKEAEEEFITSSAEQLAELYEMPKLIVIVQYVISMLFPHITRILKAQAEKMELENESKKIDLEEKKRKVEEGRKQVNPEQVYSSIMTKETEQNGNQSN